MTSLRNRLRLVLLDLGKSRSTNASISTYNPTQTSIKANSLLLGLLLQHLDMIPRFPHGQPRRDQRAIGLLLHPLGVDDPLPRREDRRVFVAVKQTATRGLCLA